MSSPTEKQSSGIFKLRLPATSANLGPGFDAVALAMTLYLEIGAEAAPEFSIAAAGRNTDVCGRLRGNLLLDTYADVLRSSGVEVVPLAIRMNNGIPLGMGCGSSAAVILAGVMLASRFGGLGWTGDQVLAEACSREGHPDNAAACWLGGFAVAAMEQGSVHAVSLNPKKDWKLLLALPKEPLATKTARGLLPESYSRADAVFNAQRVALLTAAFAEGRGDLLRIAMQDRLHQPYRQQVCPLLPALLPLAGQDGILGSALSGAGPAVLMVLDESASEAEVAERLRVAALGNGAVEILICGIANQPAAWS